MQDVSSTLETRLATRARKPGVLLEIYPSDYLPAGAFDPADAIERFSISTINWNGQDYRREMKGVPQVRKNSGKEFNNLSLSFSNMDRYMADFFLTSNVEGMWCVYRYVERDITDSSVVLFVGRCDRPGDVTQTTAGLTAKDSLASVTQRVPWRKFQAKCPLTPVFKVEGEDCVGFHADNTAITLAEKSAAYLSFDSCPGGHGDCAARENLRFFQGFFFQPIAGSFQFQTREQHRFLLFFSRTRTRNATGQYSNADGTPYNSPIRQILGRAQLEGIPIKFIDEGSNLIGWYAYAEGKMAAIINLRNNTVGFSQPFAVSYRLGDYGGNNGQDPVEHLGTLGEYYSRLAYTAVAVSGSGFDVVDSPPLISAVCVGEYPLPDEDGHFTLLGATDNPAYLARFFLSDHHALRQPAALIDDSEAIETARWCDYPLLDDAGGEALPLPASAAAEGGTRFRNYLSTGVRDAAYYRRLIEGTGDEWYEREIDYNLDSFPDGEPPDTIAIVRRLRKRYSLNLSIAEDASAVDVLYDNIYAVFRGYHVRGADGKLKIRSERPADNVYLRAAAEIDDTTVAVDDVEPWRASLRGWLLLGTSLVTSEVREVILATYSEDGNGTPFAAVATGTVSVSVHESKFLGGGPATPYSDYLTLGGTPEAGAQVQVTIDGSASATYTFTADDTLESAAALLADTVNADETLRRIVRAVWSVDDPFTVNFYLRWGTLTLDSALDNDHDIAEEGIRVLFVFDETNILKGTFKWPGNNRTEYNRWEIHYRDAKADFAQTMEFHDDEESQTRTGKVNTRKIDGAGVDNYHQAYRLLLAQVAKDLDGNKFASWDSQRGTALLVEEGDVGCVSDSSSGLVHYAVRAEQISIGAKLTVSFTARQYSTAQFVDTPPAAPVKIPSTLLEIPASQTALRLMNLPLLRDSDIAAGALTTPGVLVAAGLPSGTAQWPTAELWIDRGAGYVKLADLSAEATIGKAVFALPTATAGAWDTAHTVTVDLNRPFNGPAATLPSGTLSNPVRIILGTEVIDYVTATQLSTVPNRWRLSGGLYRGAQETGDQVGSHVPDERFVLVAQAVKFVAVEFSDVGVARDFKIIQRGNHPQQLANVSAVSFTVAHNYGDTDPTVEYIGLELGFYKAKITPNADMSRVARASVLETVTRVILSVDSGVFGVPPTEFTISEQHTPGLVDQGIVRMRGLTDANWPAPTGGTFLLTCHYEFANGTAGIEGREGGLPKGPVTAGELGEALDPAAHQLLTKPIGATEAVWTPPESAGVAGLLNTYAESALPNPLTTIERVALLTDKDRGLRFNNSVAWRAVRPIWQAAARYEISGLITTVTGSMTNGSALLHLDAAWDIQNGQGVYVPGARAASGHCFIVVSGAGTTTLTLNLAATAPVSSATVERDDTAAIIAFIAAGVAAGSVGFEFYSAVFNLFGLRQNPSTSNAQIALPLVTVPQLSIAIVGEDGPHPSKFTSGVNNSNTIFRSKLTSGGGCVFGVRDVEVSQRIWLNLLLRNLTLELPPNPTYSGIDLGWVVGPVVENIKISTGQTFDALSVPTTTTSFGLRLPLNNKAERAIVRGVTLHGLYRGMDITEQAKVNGLTVANCAVGIYGRDGNWTVLLENVNLEHNKRHLVLEKSVPPDATGHLIFKPSDIDIEDAADGIWTTDYDIDDPDDLGFGAIVWNKIISGEGPTTDLLRRGGNNLALIRALDIGAAYPTHVPVVTSGAGAITTLGVHLTRFQKTGKHVDFRMAIVVDVNGTAGGYIQATLPFTNKVFTTFTGLEISGSPFVALLAYSPDAGSSIVITKLDGSYPGGSGKVLIVNGAYEAL